MKMRRIFPATWSRTKRLIAVLVGVVIVQGALVGAWLWVTRPITAFASRFSESAFQTLPLGIDERTAVERLGEPLSKRSFEDTEVWYYSRPLSKNFAQRNLVFDRNHVLIKKVAYEVSD